MVPDEPKKRENRTGILRFKKGTDLKKVPHLAYMLQLMGCLEAIHSALRWLGHVENETSFAKKLDKLVALSAGAAWCAEAFKLLRNGKAKGAVFAESLGGQAQLLSLWDRITAEKPDELISKIYRIRDKHFAHFDAEVMDRFIALQDRIGATESYLVLEEFGNPLESRFLWPTAAFIFDIFPDPHETNRAQKVDDLVAALAGIWALTANLIKEMLESWRHTNDLNWEEVEGGIA
jgi:hypothetical protein